MFAALAMVATLGVGCAGPTDVGVSYGVGYAASPAPYLVDVGGGVYVVENYGVPVFFRNGYYWRYSDGVWFRSPYYNAGYVRVGLATVPYAIRRIDRPYRYRYYRPRHARYYRYRARSYDRRYDHRRYEYRRRHDRRVERHRATQRRHAEERARRQRAQRQRQYRYRNERHRNRDGRHRQRGRRHD